MREHFFVSSGEHQACVKLGYQWVLFGGTCFPCLRENSFRKVGPEMIMFFPLVGAVRL